jgi:hypothetical protein
MEIVRKEMAVAWFEGWKKPYKTSAVMAALDVDLWTRDLPNRKQ